MGSPVHETIRPEIAAELGRDIPDVCDIWLRLLAKQWSATPEKLDRLRREQAAGTDLLSLLGPMFRGDERASSRSLRCVLAQLRKKHRSLADLFTEVTELEHALKENFFNSGLPAESPRQRLACFFRQVLQRVAPPSSAEAVGGRCGYCRIGPDGTIETANTAALDLLNAEAIVGRSIFEFVDKELPVNLPWLKKATLRRFTSRSTGEGDCPIHVAYRCSEDGASRGHALIIDPSELEEANEGHPQGWDVGILRFFVNEENEQLVKFSNTKFAEMVGAEARQLYGLFPEDFVDDPEELRMIKEKADLRVKGTADEYHLVMRRFDTGRKAPVRVTALPRFEESGALFEVYSTVTNRQVDFVLRQARTAGEGANPRQMVLDGLADAVANVIPYDCFIVSEFASDDPQGVSYARPLYWRNPPPFEFPTRWFAVNAALTKWLARRQRIDDYDEFLMSDMMADLRGSQDVRIFKDQGYKSALIRPVFNMDGKFIATVSIWSKQLRNYSEAQARLFLDGMSIGSAVEAALYYANKADSDFRSRLLKKLTAAPDVDTVAATLVKELAEEYEWQNVSIFVVDEINCELRMKAQAEGRNGYLLPAGWVQPLTTGVLGKAFENRVSQNIVDVSKEPSYLASNKTTCSELCIPIWVAGKICWILNLESQHLSGFSLKEQRKLERLVCELQSLLTKIYLMQLGNEVIRGASDMIVVTDAQNRILFLNNKAEKILGISLGDLQEPVETRPAIEGFVLASQTGDLVGGGPINDAPFVLLNRQTKQETEIILSRRDLGEDFGRKVIFGQDFSTRRRLEELEAIRGMCVEIATETRTPLSLVDHSLRRLSKRVDQESAAAIDRALKQLRAVDMSYERLFLYDDSLLPFRSDSIDLSKIVVTVVEELPIAKIDAERIRMDIAPNLPAVTADRYQLSFVLETILAYFLRCLPEDEAAVVTLAITACGDEVIVRISGVLPPHAFDAAENALLARARAEIALGESVLRRIMQRHGGKYDRTQRPDQLWEFNLSLSIGVQGGGAL